MSSSCPDKDPTYWTTVYSLTLQGRVEDARKMLQQHPFCQSNRQVPILFILIPILLQFHTM